MSKASELLANVEMAEKFEGFEGMPYECPAGYITIGFGRNLEVYPYTREEAAAWTTNLLEERRKDIIIRHPWLILEPQEVRVILTDMAYNLGTRGVLEFKKMFIALKASDYSQAAEELKDSRYFRQTGRRAEFHYNTLKGL